MARNRGTGAASSCCGLLLVSYQMHTVDLQSWRLVQHNWLKGPNFCETTLFEVRLGG